MTTPRDAQTFLSALRKKYPEYDSIDNETLMSAVKKKYPEYADIVPNSLPKSEGFLQNALNQIQKDPLNSVQQVIRNSRMGPYGGSSITAALPSSGEEAMDFGKVALKQLVPHQPGLVGYGNQIAGQIAGVQPKEEITLPSDQFPPPVTEYGKNLDMSGNIAQVAFPLIEGLEAGGRGIKNFFSKGKLPQEIQAIENKIGSFKNTGEFLGRQVQKATSSKKNLRNLNIKEAQNVAAKGFDKITNTAEGRFAKDLENYKAELANIDPNKISIEDLVKSIDDTLEAKGGVGASYNSPQEIALKQIRDRLVGSAEQVPGSPEVSNMWGTDVIQEAVQPSVKFKNLSRPGELKYFQNEVYQATRGRKDLEGEFFNNFGRIAKQKGASGLLSGNDAYSKSYKIYDDVSAIKQSDLKRIAIGSPHATEYDISKLAQAESELGTGVVKGAKVQGQKAIGRQNKLEKYIEQTSRRKQAKEDQIPGLEMKKQGVQSQLDKIMGRRQAVGKISGKFLEGLPYGAGAIAGGGGLYGIYKLLSGQ